MQMLITILIFGILIAFNCGLIIGMKVRKIDKNKHCKVIHIKSYLGERDDVIKKLNKLD